MFIVEGGNKKWDSKVRQRTKERAAGNNNLSMRGTTRIWKENEEKKKNNCHN